MLKLFGSSEHIPDDLLERWSMQTELVGPETIGCVISPFAREVAAGSARYNHASDFLHRLLKEMDRKVH